MNELLTRENGMWAIVILLLGLVSGIIGYILAEILTPVLGALGGIGAFVLSIMKAANVVFTFIDNVESQIFGKETDGEEPPTIGGTNVTYREEFINEQLDRLDGWFKVYEEDTWEITPRDSISGDPKFLLYLLAAKVASENGARDLPKVSLEELDEIDTKSSTEVFVNKSQHFLTLHYDHDEEWVGHTIEEHQAMIEFDFDAIEEGVDWILSGNRNPPREYDSG